MNMPKPIADCSVSASLHDHRQHVRQPTGERDDDDEPADEIQRDLQRRELLGRAADRLDAADDDRPTSSTATTTPTTHVRNAEDAC